MSRHPYSYQPLSLAQQETPDERSRTRPRAMSTSRASVGRYVPQGSYGSHSIPFQEERLDTDARIGGADSSRYRSAYKSNSSQPVGSSYDIFLPSYPRKSDAPNTFSDDPNTFSDDSYRPTDRRSSHAARPRSSSRYAARKEEEVFTDDSDEREDMSDTEAKIHRFPYSMTTNNVAPANSKYSAGSAHMVPPQPIPHRGRQRANSSTMIQAQGPMRPQSRASIAAEFQGDGREVTRGEANFHSNINMHDPTIRRSAEPSLYVPLDAYNELLAKFQSSQIELEHSRSETLLAQNACDELRKSNSALQKELREVKQALDDSLQLSAMRGKELVGSQVFLSKADLLSVSDLKQKMAGLNDEIFQSAAWLAELLVRREGNRTSDDKLQAAYSDHILGKPMINVLTTLGKGPVPALLAQLILQIFLTWFCCAKIERWEDNDEMINTFLRDMYRKIHSAEEQAVSGRWRAITRSQARLSSSKWAAEVSSTLVRILPTSGYDPSSYPQSEFEEKLKPLFKTVLDLRIALGEQFTSSDIQPHIVSPGRRFDTQIMQDTLADSRSYKENQDLKDARSDIVIATTGMGLTQWVPPGTRGASGTYRLVMLPEVIRQSTLDELLRPPPSKESRSRRSINTGLTRV